MTADRRLKPNPDALPPASAEFVVIRTGAQAMIAALGRRKGERFIKEWTRLLANEETVHLLFPTRSPAERDTVVEAQRRAVAWMRQALPTLMNSLPPT